MRCATLVGTANDVEPNQAHTKLYGSACMLCLTARVRHCQVPNHYLSVLSLCCFDKNNDAVENVCKGHVNHHYMPLPLCCKGFGCCRRHQHPQATIKTLKYGTAAIGGMANCFRFDPLLSSHSKICDQAATRKLETHTWATLTD